MDRLREGVVSTGGDGGPRRRKRRRRRAPLMVWVPPGTSFVASSGVQVLVMGTPMVPYAEVGRRRARGDGGAGAPRRDEPVRPRPRRERAAAEAAPVAERAPAIDRPRKRRVDEAAPGGDRGRRAGAAAPVAERKRQGGGPAPSGERKRRAGELPSAPVGLSIAAWAARFGAEYKPLDARLFPRLQTPRGLKASYAWAPRPLPGIAERAGAGDRQTEAAGQWRDDGLDVSVPPEIEQMAQKVMARYDMRVHGMQLITTKPDKGGAIWRIETDRGPRSLKLLHRPPARSLFSVGAQHYLHQQGARVPELIRNRDGHLCTEVDGRLWIVTEWLEGLTQATKVDLAGAQQLCYGLGEFHRLSRGYVPPEGARIATRLHKWPRTYEKVLAKIGWFREIARAYPEMPASPTLLSMVDTFEQQAREALQRLEQSPYAALAARGEPYWGIVHQGGAYKGEMCGGLNIVERRGESPALGCHTGATGSYT